jgi:hypothetical protein
MMQMNMHARPPPRCAQISTVPYSASAATVGRHCLSSPACACMHVRMPLGEGCNKEALVSPYPAHTASSLFKTGLRFGPSFVGRGALRDEWSVWERVVMPQIARIIVTAPGSLRSQCTLLCIRALLLALWRVCVHCVCHR